MSDTLTVPEADNPVALFKSVVAEERWLRGDWHRQGDDGRHYLCLAAAFGKPGDITDTSQCPVGLLPQWLFSMMPTLDDNIAVADVPWLFKGFAQRIDGMVKLDAAAWDRIRTGLLIATVRQAIEAATPAIPSPTPDYWPQVTAAADQVIAALEGKGDMESAKAAAWAADAAARAAARAAADQVIAALEGKGDMESAKAAARAADAAARAAASAAEAAAWAAWAAARAAARAAWAAEAAARAAEAAAWAAEAAARAAEAAAGAAGAAARAAASAAARAAWAAASAAARAAATRKIAETLFNLIDAEINETNLA